MGFGELFDQLNELILTAASGWWTLVGLFIFCVGDGVLPVLPSDALVVGLGSVQDSTGTPHWLWVILVAAGGAVVGDFIAWNLGRWIGTHRFQWMRQPRPQRTLVWARHELDKRGVLLIFVGRFIPGARVAINFVAGSTQFSLRRFLLIDSAASLLWASWLTGLGMIGEAIIGNMLIAMVVGIGVAIVLGWISERLFKLFTGWLDRRGYHLDPKGYQDIGEVPVEPPIHIRRRPRDKNDGDDAS
jgi:membrane-associated protein